MNDLPTTVDKIPNDDRKPPYTVRKPEDTPAYSQATTSPPATTSSPSPSQVISLSRNRQEVIPFSEPINGLHIHTRDAIRGAWTLDPQAPLPTQNLVRMFIDGAKEKMRALSRSRSAKAPPPTAMYWSRHACIHATLRVVGDSALRSVATIRSGTHCGDIVLDLVSIAPMRTVHIYARSKKGAVTLLVPRSFSGVVQLSTRRASGTVELLPVLAASACVIKAVKKETTVLLGDGSMPAVGADVTTDTARIYSRSARVTLGFSGEDEVLTIPSGRSDRVKKLMQKVVPPSSQSYHRVP